MRFNMGFRAPALIAGTSGFIAIKASMCAFPETISTAASIAGAFTIVSSLYAIREAIREIIARAKPQPPCTPTSSPNPQGAAPSG